MTQTNSRKLRWLPWVLGLSVLINTGFVTGFIYHRHIMLPAPERLAAVLRGKGIPHNLDMWGYDVDHDWPWWRKMLDHYIGGRLGW